MTTIIAHNGQLMADRRKHVNGHRVGVIGVRDEPKIHKTEFCLFGTSGFDISKGVEGFEEANLEVLQMLAILFTCTYFTGTEVLKNKLYTSIKEKGELMEFFMLRKRLKSMRGIFGSRWAIEMEKKERGVVAMNREKILLASDGFFGVYDNDQQVVIGAGRKMAAIMLDNGMAYPEVYHRLRLSGMPTGVKLDTYKAADLPNLIPPVWDEILLELIYTKMRDQMDREKHAGELSDEQEHDALEGLTTILATFLSFATVKADGTVIRQKPRFDFTTPESRETKEWITARDITKFKAKEK